MVRSVIVATALLVSCARPSPQDADARGRECLARHDYACAVRAFGTAVDRSPSEPRFRYNLALTLAKMGALEQAATEAEIAVSLDPADIRPRRLLQRIHRAIAVQNARLILDD